MPAQGKKHKHTNLVWFAMMGLAVFSYGFETSTSRWTKSSDGISESSVTCLAVDSQNKHVIFAATDRRVYRSQDYGRHFRTVLNIFSSRSRVNRISFGREAGAVYAATDEGIYASRNSGFSWKKIFSASSNRANRCFDTAEFAGNIYAATGQGVFIKEPGAPSWRKMTGRRGSEPVYAILSQGDTVYFRTATAIYREDIKTHEVQVIFERAGAEQNGLEETADAELSDDIIHKASLRDFIVEPLTGVLFVATDAGIYKSADKGRTWTELSRNRLPYQEINALAVISVEPSHGQEVSPRPDDTTGNNPAEGAPVLFAATDKGVYYFANGTWEALYQGMETSQVFQLAHDGDNRLYAATDKGVFYLSVGKALTHLGDRGSTIGVRNSGSGVRGSTIGNRESTIGDRDFEPRIPNTEPRTPDTESRMPNTDPTIRQVQQLAIDYAEVHPDKIKTWRKAAQKRAWLPTFSVGIDVDKNKTVGDSIYGSYTNGGAHYVGPDDKTFYNNFAFDVSLSWDLGDLIYSSDQTSIDSRSKLMVELREDVLNEVTRLYFERRRLQVEMAMFPEQDPQAAADKELRLEELTALIDAMTGGRFSNSE